MRKSTIIEKHNFPPHINIYRVKEVRIKTKRETIGLHI